uniref:Uncharacterized protein n=1 Tax=Kryptolebias marmoratus TaxID=37003 RepID=A0A3Q3A2A6_KRYMA
IRPISKTVEILVTGLDAASLSFLASNLGLKSSTGSLYANEGISFDSFFLSSFFSSSLLFNSIWCMIQASHIFVALGASSVRFSFWPISGNLGSSCSTTMCFLSLDHPVILDFRPFGFCITLRRDSGAGGISSDSFFSLWDLFAEVVSSFLCFSLTSANSVVGMLTAIAGAEESDSEPSGLIFVTEAGVTFFLWTETSAFVSVTTFFWSVWPLSFAKSIFTALNGSWSPPLTGGYLDSRVSVVGLVS